MGGISFEGANPRHEHEWKVFEEVKLPDDKVIIPGVIDSTTNFIEHPELVAERICRFADFDRLFREVPSKHNGITFCVGTRYESGEDVFKGIRHFGSQGKLFHVHFRNVKGPLPSRRGYSEVMVDDGDLPMAKVLRTLDEAGYNGVIDYDHPMRITGDQPLPKQYIAFAVGYMRGPLHNLPTHPASA